MRNLQAHGWPYTLKSVPGSFGNGHHPAHWPAAPNESEADFCFLKDFLENGPQPIAAPRAIRI